MNDTTNTTAGLGGMTPPSAPQMPPVPGTPPVQPFSTAPASPVFPPAAQTATPSFGATDTANATVPSAPAWTPPTPSPASPSFSSPTPPTAPTPVAGSANWGPSSMSTTPTAPAWTAPSSAIPSTPVVPSTPTPSGNDFKPEHEGKSKLPLVIAGILLILAMAGGYFLYMLYQTPAVTQETPIVEAQITPTEAPVPTMTEEQQAQQSIDALGNVSESDEVESLQKDVDNTDLSTVDSNLTPAAQ